MAAKTSPATKTKRSVQKKTTPKNIAFKQTESKKSSSYITRKNIIIAVIVFAVLSSLFLLKNFLTAATVNGESIYRLNFISELEKQDGKKVLEGMITQKLIEQEAKRQNIVIENKDVDSEIKKIEDNLKQRGQDLNSVLALQGLTIDKIKGEIKINLIVKKLLSNKLTVTDKEITDYIEKNKDSIPQDSKPEDIKNEVKLQLEQEKLQEKAQELIKSLQDKAKINYFIKL